MNTPSPNPWNFSNIDKNLISPNEKFKVQFDELYEIAMGAPIGGTCNLIFDNKKIELNKFCGGPVSWNETSDKIALPIWTKYRTQQIAVVDINKMTIITFKEIFTVLHLEKFDNNLIKGINSPIHLPSRFEFNIDTEKIANIKSLK